MKCGFDTYSNNILIPRSPNDFLAYWRWYLWFYDFFSWFCGVLWHNKTTNFQWNHSLFFKNFWIGLKTSISRYNSVKPQHFYWVWTVFCGMWFRSIDIFVGFSHIIFSCKQTGKGNIDKFSISIEKISTVITT